MAGLRQPAMSDPILALQAPDLPEVVPAQAALALALALAGAVLALLLLASVARHTPDLPRRVREPRLPPQSTR
jgi:hypothetical protein